MNQDGSKEKWPTEFHSLWEHSGRWSLEWYQDIVQNEGKIALK